MKIKEFRKEYMGKNSKWDFSKFTISCNKCGSKKIEFNGYMETEEGYYNDFSIEGAIIVKCHSCGNAIRMGLGSYEELNNNGENSIHKCFKCDKQVKFLNNEGLCKSCGLKKCEKQDGVKV